ncbi:MULTISPECIES: hypothetical protein [Roseivirga]|uniref:Uncharacterized protein n=1 Tax=Roseivirga spongicola TaxID=333140 RepID=A0A150X9Z9_9BACT|nr:MULTISPECIES: hypothetical protein [Roseivirga]KYG75533.1 hypothetical protein AWW68_19670 [Roseivirga spongicola]MBO6497715.1 hypothetical protein [Roseivirga sp.]MBO6762273.1 hypothetical protein [Roseivirga sp.]WPZ12334.1 hypothetical protein T7867_09470 [Roseivirga spongicola]
MILRQNGYYLEEPSIIGGHRIKSDEIVIALNAYYFKSFSELMVASQVSRIGDLVDFTAKSFDFEKCIPMSYTLKGNQVIVQPINIYGSDYTIDIKNANLLFNNDTKKELRFTEWPSNSNMNEINAKIIRDTFEPFDCGDYQLINT